MPKLFALLTLIAGSSALLTVSAAWGQRAQSLQDPAQVVAEVEAFLQAQAVVYPGSASISVETPRLGQQSQCDRLEPFLSSGQRLRSRMTVGVRCMAPNAWTTYVQANLSIQGYYYVANRSINVGDTLGLDDLNAREGDILRLSNGVVFDPSQVVGYIAQQRIPVGAPIKSSALRDPDSIVRGQAVRTEARGVGFVANGEGQALQSGAPGAQIQVRTSSGQIVTGTVVNGTTVQVTM
ncbi:flagellar basal body P-ring formation chaperone FlgA [Parapusillimonas sp. JC17]|uniref:flagellar basal body P-ring formation chaperone FlgA n=1 Tax=Parapusillimonas sp. JC17 TaxID=3445768 RepID=UPI003FA0196E